MDSIEGEGDRTHPHNTGEFATTNGMASSDGSEKLNEEGLTIIHALRNRPLETLKLTFLSLLLYLFVYTPHFFDISLSIELDSSNKSIFTWSEQNAEEIASAHVKNIVERRLTAWDWVIIYTIPILSATILCIAVNIIVFGWDLNNIVPMFSTETLPLYLLIFYFGLSITGSVVVYDIIIRKNINSTGQDSVRTWILSSFVVNIGGIIRGGLGAVVVSCSLFAIINTIYDPILNNAWALIFSPLIVVPAIIISLLIRYIYVPMLLEEQDEWERLIKKYQKESKNIDSIGNKLGIKIPNEKYEPVQFETLEAATEAFNEFESVRDEYQSAANKYEYYQSNLRERVDLVSEHLDGINPRKLTIENTSKYGSPEEIEKAIIDVESWLSIYERYHRLCQDARQTYTIEDLSGIGPAKADALQVAGIESVEDVVETDVTHIQEIKGIGSQQAQRIKSEANKLVPKSSVSEDPVIVDEQLLDTVENRYSPDYESLTEAEESLDTLESWINIYHWYNKLYRRARECQEDLTIEDINLPGIGSTKLSALQDIGIYTINDAMKADIEDLTRAPGIGNRLAHKIKDCVNDLAMLTSYENHINILVSRYSPEYDSLREAQKLLNEFEAWIETHERFKKCYISGIAWEPKCKTEIQLEDGQTFEIPYGDYRPSRFNSVNDARRNIRTLEMVFEIIEFLAETDSNHPSVDANSWYEAISTALEEQYPEILEPIQSQVKRMSDSLWQSEDLFKYNWSEFEDLIGTLYRKQGYDVEVTQNVADKGVDIWAKKDDETVAIQVKHLGSARLSWGAM